MLALHYTEKLLHEYEIMMMESDQIINYSALDNEHTGVVKKII